MIELLIVVAIIGILATLALPNFLNALTRSRVCRAISDMRALHQSMESYAFDHGAYPVDYDYDWVYWDDTKAYMKLTTPTSYIGAIPLDPFYTHPIDPMIKPYPQKYSPSYYRYEGLFYGPSIFLMHTEWVSSNTYYTITSNGPSYRVEGAAFYSPSNPVLNGRLYHPSNGLFSAGDLYVSNHGVVCRF